MYVLETVVIAGVVISAVVLRYRIPVGDGGARPESDAVSMRRSAYLTVVVLLSFVFLLPSSPVLGSFGYPHREEILKGLPSSPERVAIEKVITNLQEQNTALCRVITVLDFLCIVLVFAFVLPFAEFARVIGANRESRPEVAPKNAEDT